MSMRYKGGIISATAPTTSATATADKGVWTLQSQLQAQAAGTWPPLVPTIQVLLVAGGGSGGVSGGAGTGSGGGGAGGVQEYSYLSTKGTTYTVTVGSGAPAGDLSNGVDTTISVGGSNLYTATKGYGAAGVVCGGPGGASGNGYAGGGSYCASFNERGGGGGGAAGAGTAGTGGGPNGYGGIALQSSIPLSPTYFGGGGGGGGYGSTGLGGGTAITSQKGGGGDGGNPGNAGTANTGGGGGGSLNQQGGAGAGGSGVVVLRYPDSYPALTTTGSPTVTVSGGYRIYTFTGSGSYTV